MQIIEVGSGVVQSIPWFAWLGLAGIIGAFSTVTLKMVIIHRERMAMLRSGIDPDAPHRKPVYEDVVS